jgi:glycosyltransferase involved in cell wall biosynthesis
VSLQFVLLSHFKSWNLEALARESAESLHQTYSLNFIPSRKMEIHLLLSLLKLFFIKGATLIYFNQNSLFAYPRLATRVMSRNRVRVWVSHFDDIQGLTKSQLQLLSDCDLIFVQNLKLQSTLVSLGTSFSKIKVIRGAIDYSLFKPNPNQVQERVIITGFCKPRKNPEAVHKIITANPTISFLIHGNGWEAYFSRLGGTPPNCHYSAFNYKDQPKLISNSTCLLSLATEEGGPLSILESLACGTPVLASPVGFWPDIVSQNNGEVLDFNDEPISFSNRFHRMKSLKLQVQERDLTGGIYSFSNLAKALLE